MKDLLDEINAKLDITEGKRNDQNLITTYFPISFRYETCFPIDIKISHLNCKEIRQDFQMI